MGILSDILGGVAEDLYNEIPTQITSNYTTALPQITAPDVTFQPFTVTSSLGSTTGGPSGTTYNLSPRQQYLQDALMREAQYRIGGSPMGAIESMFTGADVLNLGRQMIGQGPYGLSQQQQASQQAFDLGSQFMGSAGQQAADVDFLRRQYGTMAGLSALDVLTPTAAREGSVYERIRATQRPEEERQRLALEERLASQGRLGVRTAMYGGTPEQLALAKAQEEAQDRASLAALTQAQAERQQALSTAQTLGSMFAGQATLGGTLQAQQAGLGQQYANLGSSLATQRQALDAARQLQMLQAITGGQGIIAGSQGLEGAELDLGLRAMQAGYAPQAAMLSALSPALNIASMSDVARRQQGEYALEAALANLSGKVGQQSALGSLYGSMFTGAGSLIGSLTGAGGDIIAAYLNRD